MSNLSSLCIFNMHGESNSFNITSPFTMIFFPSISSFHFPPLNSFTALCSMWHVLFLSSQPPLGFFFLTNRISWPINKLSEDSSLKSRCEIQWKCHLLKFMYALFQGLGQILIPNWHISLYLILFFGVWVLESLTQTIHCPGRMSLGNQRTFYLVNIWPSSL